MYSKVVEALFTAIEILIDKNDIDGVKKVLKVVLQPNETEKDSKE